MKYIVLGIPFLGGLAYIATSAVLNAVRKVDDALASIGGDDDE